jgi:hypothetical protein
MMLVRLPLGTRFINYNCLADEVKYAARLAAFMHVYVWNTHTLCVASVPECIIHKARERERETWLRMNI